MNPFEHDSPELSRVHRQNNDKKFFCHFTGFLEGIAASGYIENGEVEPLIAEAIEFVTRVADGDANDIIEDFEADILAHEMVADAVAMRLRDIDPSCEKSKLNYFLGFARGIACDGKITKSEAEEMVNKLEASPSLLSVVGAKQVYVVCVDALEDGIVTENESMEICDAIGDIVGDCYADTGIAQSFGVANFGEYRMADLEAELEGTRVVLTGNFQTRPRSILEARLAEFGCQLDKHVSGRTDFLIIGGEASRDWIEMNRGTKMRKAQELRLKADTPLFVSESQLMRALDGR